MSGNELPLSTLDPIDEQRYREGRKVTWVSVGVNVVLTVSQIFVGLIAHAQSLVADGFHSLSDLVADFLVLVANFHSRHPADDDHPYGHQRIETVASLALGLLLAATGAAILWYAVGRLQNLENLPAVAPIALWVALATLAAKEGLFRYMLRVGERLRSPMLIANAWHARSDAASSLVAAAGICGSLLGVRWLDPVAAVIVGFMILRMGAEFAWKALRELMDEGLTADEVAAIRATLVATPGVINLHELRTRRMAHQVLVDAHVQVAARISVSEGHRIAEQARARVLAKHEEVMDVLVHIDAEDDLQPPASAIKIPAREELVRHLDSLLGIRLPNDLRVVFHYLGNRVEADIFLPHDLATDPSQIARMQSHLQAQLVGDPWFSSVRLSRWIAPTQSTQ